jgi:TolA-binding protein
MLFLYYCAKKLYEEGQFEEAEKLLKIILKEKPKTEEAKKSHYLLAETYFANHDYATAAIEYGEFKKKYPKDTLVANCTYRQAQAFKNMNKNSEAKLFFQEIVDSFPKHPLAPKAKQELKKLK